MTWVTVIIFLPLRLRRIDAGAPCGPAPEESALAEVALWFRYSPELSLLSGVLFVLHWSSLWGFRRKPEKNDESHTSKLTFQLMILLLGLV